MNKTTNALSIIKSARMFQKKVMCANSSNFDVRIAVIGSFSIQHLVMVIRYLLFKNGIRADIYEGDYNGIAMDSLDTDSSLYSFDPDIVIVLPHYTDINIFPCLFAAPDEIDAAITREIDIYKRIWASLTKGRERQILQSNIVYPIEYELGNLEDQYNFSKTNFFRSLNRLLVSESPTSVNVVDLDTIASWYGKYNWFDYSGYFLSKIGFKLEYIEPVAEVFVRQIMAYKGMTRKCIVLDLDNTLWGGVVGDEGVDGIQLDPNHAVGEAYRYFQKYLLALKQRGVILAVCSKNDEYLAKEPFKSNRNMVLSLDDISCFVANWSDKATNMIAISKQLNIGLDSMVFFDDNPAEREIIKRYLPEVKVIDVPEDPADYVKELVMESPFEWLQLTKEDVLRSNSYIENRKRQNLQDSFVDYSEYLKVLEMSGGVYPLTEEHVARFSQLINKTNQFNVRTQRYSEAQIKDMMNDPNYYCLYTTLNDKFSTYGIISCVILKITGKDCFIDSWVMSCRVIKRGVEYLNFNKIINIAKQMGCTKVMSEYIKTPKNVLVVKLFDDLGFDCIACESDNKRYRYFVDERTLKQHFISVEA